MIGKNYFYKSSAIPTFKDDAISSGWIATDIDWNPPTIENSQINRQDYHGVVSNPTISRGRIIEISGIIYGKNKLERGLRRNIVNSLFQLEGFPLQGEGFYDLEFEDDDGTAKKISAKVFAKPDYENDQGNVIVAFSLQLFSQDGLIRSQALVKESGGYGQIGGVFLPTTLPASLDGSIGKFSITNSGDFDAQVRATITGDIVNPKIINLTTGMFFRIERTITTSDTLIIDTSANSGRGDATINGTSILSARGQGSNFLYAQPGVNEFILIGENFDPADTGKASVQIEFYSTWL